MIKALEEFIFQLVHIFDPAVRTIYQPFLLYGMDKGGDVVNKRIIISKYG